MALVILIGPQAVGKMTVGQHLEDLSGYKLFHNHQAIDIVAPFFSYGTPEGRGLVHRIRQAFFEMFAKSDGNYIFTFVWAFNVPGEKDYVDAIVSQFEDHGHETFIIELVAPFETRLERNQTQNRLAHKPTKRDIAWSERLLRESEANHRTAALPGEIDHPRSLKIDNTDLPPSEAAQQIWRFISSFEKS